ncbi:MAG: GNAT family N-acetyltransferase, partial [Pararhodobacter sp.]
MILRDATSADAPAIGAIWNAIIRDTAITFWPTERSDAEIAAIIRERQAAGLAFLVAQTDA